MSKEKNIVDNTQEEPFRWGDEIKREENKPEPEEDKSEPEEINRSYKSVTKLFENEDREERRRAEEYLKNKFKPEIPKK